LTRRRGSTPRRRSACSGSKGPDQGDHRVRHARDLLTLRSPSGARALTGSS
jgi:hypothetical protein